MSKNGWLKRCDFECSIRPFQSSVLQKYCKISTVFVLKKVQCSIKFICKLFCSPSIIDPRQLQVVVCQWMSPYVTVDAFMFKCSDDLIAFSLSLTFGHSFMTLHVNLQINFSARSLCFRIEFYFQGIDIVGSFLVNLSIYGPRSLNWKTVRNRSRPIKFWLMVILIEFKI